MGENTDRAPVRREPGVIFAGINFTMDKCARVDREDITGRESSVNDYVGPLRDPELSK